MLKLIYILLFSYTKPQDAEFDIEHIKVIGVERIDGNRTLICYCKEGTLTTNYIIPCSLEKHNDFVMRFRIKIKYYAQKQPYSC